ncbi:hypothetical protein [Dietzia maris]|uniref:hypothetical protein n=1 Tax=Dietzia maris TaxID=37915 RepID=UPI0037CCB4CF
MRTLDLLLHSLDTSEIDGLEQAALNLREPDGWNAGTRGLWPRSFEAFDSLRQFVNDLANSAALRWTQGGGLDLLATFESGDGTNIMDDGLNISVALHLGDTQRTFSPLITVFVDDVAAFLGDEPTATSAATAILDAINQTLAHFAGE